MDFSPLSHPPYPCAARCQVLAFPTTLVLTTIHTLFPPLYKHHTPSTIDPKPATPFKSHAYQNLDSTRLYIAFFSTDIHLVQLKTGKNGRNQQYKFFPYSPGPPTHHSAILYLEEHLLCTQYSLVLSRRRSLLGCPGLGLRRSRSRFPFSIYTCRSSSVFSLELLVGYMSRRTVLRLAFSKACYTRKFGETRCHLFP